MDILKCKHLKSNMTYHLVLHHNFNMVKGQMLNIIQCLTLDECIRLQQMFKLLPFPELRAQPPSAHE